MADNPVISVLAVLLGILIGVIGIVVNFIWGDMNITALNLILVGVTGFIGADLYYIVCEIMCEVEGV